MITCIDTGVVPYGRGLKWQKHLVAQRRANRIPDHILFLEHPPVYTMGRRDSASDLLVAKDQVRGLGIEIHKTDRGGGITYHGPGQLVGYLIFRLRDSVPRFVWKVEEALLGTLERYHLEAGRDNSHPGIWVEDRKIAALGFRIERGITYHGFALNVTCDLSPFQHIRPCGIPDRGVTSIEKETGWTPSLRDVKRDMLLEFSRVFRTRVTMAGDTSQIPE